MAASICFLSACVSLRFAVDNTVYLLVEIILPLQNRIEIVCLIRSLFRSDEAHLDDPNYTLKYTGYAALVSGTSVCQGYAAAFNLLASKVGIRSIAVAGDAGGDSHAWNYVRNGNTYCYIDTTWDDPVPDGGPRAKVSHKFFYLTQKQMEKTHTWDKIEHAKKYVDYASVLQ